MKEYAPFIRIILRYMASFGIIGGQVAQDGDLVTMLSVVLAALVEFSYMKARKTGGAT